MTTDLYGLPDLDIQPGDHVCAMYFGTAQRDAFLLPYLRSGLLAGEKCICVLDATPPASMIQSLRDDMEVDSYVASTQLDFPDRTQSYLAMGRFNGDTMLDYWDGYLAQAFASGGYNMARVAGEMPQGVISDGSLEDFMDYEMALNDFVPKFPQVLLCMYDLALFGGGLVIDLLRTHPKVLMSGMVVESPAYVPN